MSRKSVLRLPVYHLAVAVILAACAAGKAAAIEMHVAAEEFDRVNAPISTPVALPDSFKDTVDVGLYEGDKLISVGQLTGLGLMSRAPTASAGTVARELHFVLPKLEKGKEAKYEVSQLKVSPCADMFGWKDVDDGCVELGFGTMCAKGAAKLAGVLTYRPVLKYICKPIDESSSAAREATFKPFHHVYDPAGKVLLTKGPGGLYTHHRGLFFGFNKVTHGKNQECDVWHCKDGAFEQHEKVLASEAGPVLARQRLAISWHGKKGVLFANEQRELTVYNVPGGTLIDFASRVTPVEGKVKFDGDPQHAGFHFRAAQEVALQTDLGQKDAVKSKSAEKGSLKPDPQTYYLRSDGKGKLGDTRNWDAKKRDPQTVNLPWNAMSIVVGGQRYTVEYMDSPSNPKEARYSERDYGRFGSYFEAEATPEKPLEVRYRVWIQPGEMTVGQAAAKDADFDHPPKVTVE